MVYEIDLWLVYEIGLWLFYEIELWLVYEIDLWLIYEIALHSNFFWINNNPWFAQKLSVLKDCSWLNLQLIESEVDFNVQSSSNFLSIYFIHIFYFQLVKVRTINRTKLQWGAVNYVVFKSYIKIWWKKALSINQFYIFDALVKKIQWKLQFTLLVIFRWSNGNLKL